MTAAVSVAIPHDIAVACYVIKRNHKFFKPYLATNRALVTLVAVPISAYWFFAHTYILL